jgi:dTDP-4-dehydrorhamnose 3,5-epimerase
MEIIQTKLRDVKLIGPGIFKDHRGCFLETWRADPRQNCGAAFVQDNLSFSKRDVLRGLHYQLGRPQGKLVMAVHGEIFDVAVDVRRGSPTFGWWTGALLSSDNRLQIFIPEGFAHGFCVLSKTATVYYKCTDYYAPKQERGIRWDDPVLGIQWPVDTPILSAKDANYLTLDALSPEHLPVFADGE